MKNLNKYLNQNPTCLPYDKYMLNGCAYSTATDLIQCGILGMCGCGMPEDNLEYIRGALEIVNLTPDRTDGWDDWYKGYREKVDSHFKSSESEYFFWYIADKNEWVEHGSGLPGWLDEKGIELLGLLNDWIKVRYDESDG